MERYETHRDQLIRSGLSHAAPAISLLVGLYAGLEFWLSPERFRPALWTWAVMLAVPLLGWLASRSLADRWQQAVLLAGDLAFTAALMSQVPQPTTSAEAAAASTCVKVLATAIFFPWGARVQLLSTAASLLLYWTALLAADRLGSGPGAIFKVVLPLIAGGLSVVGAGALEAGRRALLHSLARQGALETEQRAQLAQLRDRDRRLGLLLEQMPAALWSTDAELRFTSSRGSILQVIGIPDASTAAPTLFEYFNTSDPDFEPIAAHRAALAGESRTYEFSWHDRLFQTRVEPLRDADGVIAGTIGVAQDVTDSRRAQSEREALSRALAEDARVSASLAELGRDLVGALALPTSMSGRVVEKIARSLCCDSASLVLRDAESGDFVYAASHGLLPDALEVSRILRFRRADFEPFFARLEGGAVVRFAAAGEAATRWAALPRSMGIGAAMYVALHRSDEMMGFLAVHRHTPNDGFEPWQVRALREMANLAALALENARLLEELERASALKSEFLATMSHELRTPLNAIIGYTALILDGEFGDIEGEHRDVVTKVLESGQELFQLISATLDLSRLEAGRLPVTFAPTDARALLAEVAGESRALRRRPRVTFHWQIPDSLPPLVTDAAKLKVVLKNLLGNAAKFTDEGTIRVDAEASGDGIEFRVADTGCGIRPDHLETIFEPFRQGEAGDIRAQGGVGLGLYIVRRFVELLGGTVGVDSTPGRGSTFRVWVPAAGGAAQAPARP